MNGISQISSPDGSFLEILRSRNEESVSQIKQLLCNELGGLDSSKCCIFLTGSDGRREKSLHSPYEMIVVFKANISCESKDSITTRIKGVAGRNLSNFDQEIEFKELDSESVLLCKGKIIPTRAFDALRVWGNKDIKREFYAKLFNEIKDVNAKVYAKFSKNFRQNSIRQLNSCFKSGASSAHFDLSTGELLYDGKRNFATKFPCLRSMQYHTANIVFQAVRNDRLGLSEMNGVRKARRIPQRLAWLAEKGLVEEQEEASQAYTQCLYWYEQAQKAFIEEKKTNYSVDPSHLKNTATAIKSFVGRQP